MKLVCDSCGAKYSIGDDRIAGKVFKIRCKKCSHVMVIRGGAAEPVAEPAPYGEWYAVIDGGQQGPMSRTELMQRRASGAIDDDAFVWREGMDEWLAFGSVDQLREQTKVEPEPDLFARSSVATEVAGELSPPAAETKLHGERNETSVLFTLGNLAKLAAPQPQGAKATATATTGTEGSGLIDIRALASTFAPAARSTAQARGAVGNETDLPVFGPAGFDAPIVMMPMARRGPDRKLMYALVATLAMLAILGTVLVIVMTRDDKPRVADTPGPQVATLGRPPASEPPPTTATPTPAPAPAPKVEAPAPVVPAPVVPVAPTPRTIRPTTPRPTPVTPAPSTSRNPPPVRPVLSIKEPEKQECTEVHCAYSGYAEKCCEVFRSKTTTTNPQSTGSVPENLGKDELKAGIATIRAQACGGKSNARGDVSVSVKISAAGVVTAVTVKSSPDPALSSCVVAAAQKGSFAKTQRGGSFAYVWRF